MLVLFVVAAFAYDCDFTLSDGYSVDLTPMAKSSGPDYKYSDDFGNNYFANICAEIKNECSGEKKAIAAVSNAQSPCKVLGRQAPLGILEGPTVDFLDSSDPNNGVSMTYSGGDLCTIIGFIDTEVEYRISCDPNVVNQLKRAYSTSPCSYVFEFSSMFGCPIPPLNINPEPQSNGKTCLLIILLGLLGYFIIGTAYNKLKHQQSLHDSIPNKDFWTDLPGLIRDGFGFSLNKLREIKQHLDQKYSNKGHLPV